MRINVAAGAQERKTLRARGGVSLDDLGHPEKAIGLRGSVPQRLLVGEGGPGFIGAGHIDEGDRMSGRLHVAHIELAELLDVAQDLSKLGPEARLLVGRQFQPG